MCFFLFNAVFFIDAMQTSFMLLLPLNLKERSILPSSSDGKLPDILVTSLCHFYLVNGLIHFHILFYVRL